MPNILRGVHWATQPQAVAIPDWELPPEPEPEPEPAEQPDDQDQEFQEAELPVVQPEPEEAPPPPEPEPLTEQQLRELYRPQWEQMRTIAEQRAYSDTAAAYRAKLEDCLNQMNTQLAEMEKLQQDFIQQYASQLKYLAIEIAEKWVGKRMQDDNGDLDSLVRQGLQKVKDASWMKIELSDKLVDISEKIQLQLNRSEFAGKAQVVLAPTSPDSCVIRTDAGDLDASISTQAANLKKAFEAQDQLEG